MDPFRRIRDGALEVVKRRAIRLLSSTARGESVLLRIYAQAEEQAERAFLLEALSAGAPEWLVERLTRHRADEERHARMLRARLRALARGVDPGPLPLDPVSRWKLAALERRARRASTRFSAGSIVPALAVAWRMEEMGVRVLSRHVQVLAAGRSTSPTRALLRRVLADEIRHVGQCREALDRLVPPDERPSLLALVASIDRIERFLGVPGAATLLVIGAALWLSHHASCTWRSRTRAVT